MTDPSGNTVGMRAVCSWTYRFGPDTVTSYYYGDYYQAVNSQYLYEFAQDGVECFAYTDLVNYDGGAVAESRLYGSYCNTDGYTPGEGAVQSINVNNVVGAYTTVAPNFGQWYGSFAGSGNVNYGNFNFCSEDPVGQHTNYACLYYYAGPYE